MHKSQPADAVVERSSAALYQSSTPAASLVAGVGWVQRKVVRGEQLPKARVGQVHAPEPAALAGCTAGRRRRGRGV